MVQSAERYRVERIGSSAPLAILVTILAGVLFAGGCGQQDTQSDAESQPEASTSEAILLPQEALVGLDVVQTYFPEIEQQTATSENSTASGTPDATRMVIYEGGDGRRVTVSVDRYPSTDAAATAFEQAIDKSEVVPGFAALPAPADVGDKAFAGSVTQGEDTHIGYGALAGEYVIGVTSAGYPATTENVEKLAGLTRDAVEKATA
ncbi:hypothetical protein [Rhodococcus opacus]|uniref:hypothetical protein n=1 Tax=Rhodococcus opacus TaxID=37919 RepID=UPI001F575EE3|nr:hypothetical protein [Rhodococcus opacus]UNM99193.1 hypothetical protein MOO23_26390 [Rhodococcus opacus]UZG54931.1 hypothetical protein ONE62_33560 [Rhodococcus opacus]